MLEILSMIKSFRNTFQVCRRLHAFKFFFFKPNSNIQSQIIQNTRPQLNQPLKLIHFNIYYSLNMFLTWNRNKNVKWEENDGFVSRLLQRSLLFRLLWWRRWRPIFSPYNTAFFSFLSRQQCLFLSFLSFLSLIGNPQCSCFLFLVLIYMGIEVISQKKWLLTIIISNVVIKESLMYWVVIYGFVSLSLYIYIYI